MCRLPYRAAAALLLFACMGGAASSTVGTAHFKSCEGAISSSFVRPVDAPSTLHLHDSTFEIAADNPVGGEKGEPNVETALEAVYANGLPIPKPFIDKVATNAKFRVEVHATVSASIPKVIAFYRRELTKKGWMEDTGLARTDGNKSVLIFRAPEGFAELTVAKVRQGTGSDLVLRKTAEAEKSGLLPEQGMSTVLIGNTMTEPAAVTINGTTYKLEPGEGVGKPTGPKLNLAPGLHKASTVIGSKPAMENRFTVGDGEIWGLLLGPSGSLPIQMY